MKADLAFSTELADRQGRGTCLFSKQQNTTSTYHSISAILDSIPAHNALLLCTKTNKSFAVLFNQKENTSARKQTTPPKQSPPPPQKIVSKGYPFSCPITSVLTEAKQLAFFLELCLPNHIITPEPAAKIRKKAISCCNRHRAHLHLAAEDCGDAQSSCDSAASRTGSDKTSSRQLCISPH